MLRGASWLLRQFCDGSIKIVLAIRRPHGFGNRDKSAVSLRVRQLWRARLFWLLHLVSQFLRLGLLVRRSRFIGEALAFDAQQRLFGALFVMNAFCHPIIVTEVEFRKIAV